MKIGSLFSGIGGLELGLERALHAKTVFQVERDPYALQVLAQRWPEALRFSDVREVGAHNLPPVDLLCGGFPCQDVSIAGKGAGLAGARSGLWTEFARLAGELRPTWIVIENVSALLSRGLSKVLEDLAACGFHAEWDCVPAAAVGALHKRDRLFLVAWRADLERPLADADRDGRGEFGAGDVRPHEGMGVETGLDAPRRGEDLALAYADRPGREERHAPALPEGTRFDPWCPPARGSFWASEPGLGRVVDGFPERVDKAHARSRLRALGNAVVPQVAEHVGGVIRQIAEREGIPL